MGEEVATMVEAVVGMAAEEVDIKEVVVEATVEVEVPVLALVGEVNLMGDRPLMAEVVPFREATPRVEAVGQEEVVVAVAAVVVVVAELRVLAPAVRMPAAPPKPHTAPSLATVGRRLAMPMEVTGRQLTLMPASAAQMQTALTGLPTAHSTDTVGRQQSLAQAARASEQQFSRAHHSQTRHKEINYIKEINNS